MSVEYINDDDSVTENEDLDEFNTIENTEIEEVEEVDDVVLEDPEEEVESVPDENITKNGKVKYLTNKEFLLELNRSKMSYCKILNSKYEHYDAIVDSLEEITPEFITETRIKKAAKLTTALKAKLRKSGAKQSSIKEALVEPDTIPVEDVVFRVMTSAHIPLDPNRKRRGTSENYNHKKTPFLPFKHYISQNGEFEEVVRSHWTGDFETGQFDMDQGQISNRLAEMMMLLIDRYSRRANWRNYSYLQDMKDSALLQLVQVGLQFNEAVSDNPFAFFTTICRNAFLRVLNIEKKNQNIRDDLLIMSGSSPSYTRVFDHEHKIAIANFEQEQYPVRIYRPDQDEE